MMSLSVPTAGARKQSAALTRFHPWQVVLVFALAYTLVTLGLHAWDPLTFVNLGARYDPAKTNQSLGYDGQFFYQIARDPANAWTLVDVPAYRYQRILYPLLARAFALGQPGWIPWTLILINLVAIPLGTFVTESILARQGASRWYALVYGLFIGMLVSLRLDLAEPLAFLLVQLGFLAFLKQHPWQSALWFGLAALTRETTLLFAGGIFLYLVLEKQIIRAIGWGICATLPFAIWHAVEKVWLGSWGIGSGGALATSFEWIPYRGWWGVAGMNLGVFLLLSVLIFPMAILPAVLLLAASGRALYNRVATPAVLILFLNAAAFAFLPFSNLYEPLGLSRTTLGLVVAALNFGAERKSMRTLNLALLWLLTILFVYKDSFIPFN
jgi:hypothetical protein